MTDNRKLDLNELEIVAGGKRKYAPSGLVSDGNDVLLAGAILAGNDVLRVGTVLRGNDVLRAGETVCGNDVLRINEADVDPDFDPIFPHA